MRPPNGSASRSETAYPIRGQEQSEQSKSDLPWRLGGKGKVEEGKQNRPDEVEPDTTSKHRNMNSLHNQFYRLV